MAGLTLMLLDGSRVQRIERVASLVAADASGQFGVLAGHAEFVTLLEPGLWRYRIEGEASWRHAAGAGGLLHCMPRAAGETEVRIVSARLLQAGAGETPAVLERQLDALLEHEALLRLSARASQLRVDTALYRRRQELAEPPQ
jgi:F-type H+-transporting ATPase subunit epsilon